MGALHDGHLALVDRARAENASVVASLFVNPLQFAPTEDFARYPRSFDEDARRLAERGVDVVYAPEVARMYPAGFATSVDVGELATRFEGASRPGHFAGVATVVAKLLHAIEPTSLYLGQKDAQQTAVVRRFVADLDFATAVVVVPTVREPGGLALSSRNAYLRDDERAAAPSIYAALRAIAACVLAGQTDLATALESGRALLEAPLCWEYLSIVEPLGFSPSDPIVRPAVAIGVARAGTTRLLDNVTIADARGVDPLVTPQRVLRPQRVR